MKITLLMIAVVFLFLKVVLSSTRHGQFHILLAPSSYNFLEKDPLRLSNLESVISLFKGKSFEPRNWSGLALKDPFDFSQSVVVLLIPGVSTLEVESLRSYPLIRDKSVDTIVYRAMFDDDSRVVYLDEKESVRKKYHVKIQSDTQFTPPELLRTSVDSYDSFLEQLELLGTIGGKLSEDEVRGQSHWIGFTGYRYMHRMHSSDRRPAVRNLLKMIKKVTKSLEANKNVRYLFAVINYPAGGAVRRKRDEPAEAPSPASSEKPPSNNTSIDKGPGQAYGPPMFNLVFWSILTWFLILFGICIAFWNMNPGSQHAFYRLADMKMKIE